MTETERQAVFSAFKAPNSPEWRLLVGEDAGNKAQREEVRRANEELKNILLTSLQTQHVVVLAGSGCSYDAGGPKMKELWQIVSELPKAAQIIKQVGEVADENVESLLSKIEAFLQVKDTKNLRDFLNDSKKAILDRCSWSPAPEKLAGHKTFLHRLSRRGARAPRLKVFTTNYDLCFELAAAELGSVALDGFSFTAPRHHDPRFFGYDIVQRPASGDGLGQYVPGVFQLHKLHGSVNWARKGDVIQEEIVPTPEEACLIYPAKGKYQQSYTQPYLESIAQYLAAVREPNTCLVVVGFGFNDDHLSEPLMTAIETNPHLRVIVADPGAQSNESKGSLYWKRLYYLSNAGEDVWLINAGFEEFAQMIPDLKSLTPADNLVKAIKSVARGV